MLQYYKKKNINDINNILDVSKNKIRLLKKNVLRENNTCVTYVLYFATALEYSISITPPGIIWPFIYILLILSIFLFYYFFELNKLKLFEFIIILFLSDIIG